MNKAFSPVELNRRDISRIKGYQQLLDFYHGIHWEGREWWGEKRLTFNYARVFIDKVTSYLMSFLLKAAQPICSIPWLLMLLFTAMVCPIRFTRRDTGKEPGR